MTIESINIGFWCCILLVPVFGILALVFSIAKDKAVKTIAGFNTLTKEEQNLYDKKAIVKDLRNSFLVWTAIMLIGAICSLFITQIAAILAYLVWLIIVFKNVHFDTHKEFERYLLKK